MLIYTFIRNHIVFIKSLDHCPTATQRPDGYINCESGCARSREECRKLRKCRDNQKRCPQTEKCVDDMSECPTLIKWFVLIDSNLRFKKNNDLTNIFI